MHNYVFIKSKQRRSEAGAEGSVAPSLEIVSNFLCNKQGIKNNLLQGGQIKF